MEWLDILGLITMMVIMIPNCMYAIKGKDLEVKYHNKNVMFLEQIGRFGSMFFMVFHIPLLDYGYWFTNGKSIHIFLTVFLSILYCLIWILYFKKVTMAKAMLLAFIPTILFLASGIIQGKVLLIITSILFGISHHLITFYNHK